jgi:hypothetical protein
VCGKTKSKTLRELLKPTDRGKQFMKGKPEAQAASQAEVPEQRLEGGL